VLSQRASELAPVIQMCDALSRNVPKEFQVILANCIAHGRRKFVEVTENFPEECRYVLEQLREVYTRMTRWHGSKGCHPNSACTIIRSRAGRG